MGPRLKVASAHLLRNWKGCATTCVRPWNSTAKLRASPNLWRLESKLPPARHDNAPHSFDNPVGRARAGKLLTLFFWKRCLGSPTAVESHVFDSSLAQFLVLLEP